MCNRFIIFSILCMLSSAASALCGGPLDRNKFNRALDYNNASDSSEIALVERFHFDTKVEALIRGVSSPVPEDIHYTLVQIPNHYRALHAMTEWQTRNNADIALGSDQNDPYWAIDCYFERALYYKPQDPIIHMLHGIYLHKSIRLDAALKAYKTAERLRKNDPEITYNLGLLYTDRKEYDLAYEYAKQAYAGGYPLPGLKDKLTSLGIWK